MTTLSPRSATRLALVALLLSACSACGDDGNGSIDASPDGPPDSCAPAMTFTGEFITWDSTLTSFSGINAATFTHRTDTTATDMTAPNGRFDLCIPAADGFVDVTTMAGGNLIDGTVVVNKNAFTLLPIHSFRTFTTTRAADYGFSPTQAHVFVHVAGGSRTVTTAANASIQKTFDGAAWVDGNTGTDIYLGNVDPQGMTMLTVTGGTSIGAGMIPLTEGKFTFVTIVAR